MSLTGRPIFNYPPERRAPEGQGCLTCGIVLEADAIGSYCSPECCEWPDRCQGCQRGQTWCECEYTHCIDCGEPLSERDQEQRFRMCRSCAKVRRERRERVAQPNLQNIPIQSELGKQLRRSFRSAPLSKNEEKK